MLPHSASEGISRFVFFLQDENRPQVIRRRTQVKAAVWNIRIGATGATGVCDFTLAWLTDCRRSLLFEIYLWLYLFAFISLILAKCRPATTRASTWLTHGEALWERFNTEEGDKTNRKSVWGWIHHPAGNLLSFFFLSYIHKKKDFMSNKFKQFTHFCKTVFV